MSCHQKFSKSKQNSQQEMDTFIGKPASTQTIAHIFVQDIESVKPTKSGDRVLSFRPCKIPFTLSIKRQPSRQPSVVQVWFTLI